MDEAEWLAYAEPRVMLELLRGKASERKLRLFGVACCRQVWYQFTDGRSQKPVEVAERYADAMANREELKKVQEEARAYRGQSWESRGAGAVGAWLAGEVIDRDVAGWVIRAAQALREQGEANSYCTLIRDIFGNPFRPVSIDPAWRTPTVTALAQAAYEERHLPAGTLDSQRLAVLSDALEDVGCDSDEDCQDCISGVRMSAWEVYPGPTHLEVLALQGFAHPYDNFSGCMDAVTACNRTT